MLLSGQPPRLANAVKYPPMNDDPSEESMVPYLMEMLHVEERRADFLMRVVIPLGVALTHESNFNHLLERMLGSAMSLSRADGGALYLRGEDDNLRVVLFRRDSLGVAVGGASSEPSSAGAISLDDLNATGHGGSAAGRAASSGQSVSHAAREHTANHVPLPQAMDEGMGYKVESALAVPLRNHAGRVIGIIELCNARREGCDKPVPFETAVHRTIEALSLLAAVALESYLRQQKLKDQVHQLRVEVDNAKKHRQVEAIVGSDYFRDLLNRARELRACARGE
jgi:GAF domain-containing protein